MNWPLTIIIATCVQNAFVIQLLIEDTARRFALGEDGLGLLASAETGMAAGAIHSVILAADAGINAVPIRVVPVALILSVGGFTILRRKIAARAYVRI